MHVSVLRGMAHLAISSLRSPRLHEPEDPFFKLQGCHHARLLVAASTAGSSKAAETKSSHNIDDRNNLLCVRWTWLVLPMHEVPCIVFINLSSLYISTVYKVRGYFTSICSYRRCGQALF